MNFSNFSSVGIRLLTILCCVLGWNSALGQAISVNHSFTEEIDNINQVTDQDAPGEHKVENNGLTFRTPSFLFLTDLVNGAYELKAFSDSETKNQASVTGYSYTFTYDDGSNDSNDVTFDPEQLPVFTFVAPDDKTLSGGQVVWKYDVQELTGFQIGVESEFGADKVSPPEGLVVTGQSEDENFVQAFSAPEFVYLNRDFQELDELDREDETDDTKRAYYRARNLGYAIDGESVQGVDLFFERTITKNLRVIWRWELEYAVFIESSAGDNGFGNPAPGVGRVWVAKDTEFTASIDKIVGNEAVGIRFSTSGYQVTRDADGERGGDTVTTDGDLGDGEEIIGSPIPTRVVTTPFSVTDWLRIRWESNKQVRYRFDAQGGDDGQQRFDDLVYVEVNGMTQPSRGANYEVWVNELDNVTVGARYRTEDRCYTLADFISAPTGDFTRIGRSVSERLEDVEDGFVRRVYTVLTARSPSEIHWNYAPTIFRAIIPIGQSFDANNPNVQLVPDLCAGAVLRLGQEGPGAAGQPIGNLPSGDAVGDSLEWDQVRQRFFPVRPGTFRVNWPDANVPDQVHQIEIVSGFPNETVNLVSASELDDGRRELDGDDYVTSKVLDPVVDDFPAAPQAHYRHLVENDAGRQPPTKLDIDRLDEWSFQRLTFSEPGVDASVQGADVTQPFTTSGTGLSVLLFSYRQNPDEVADGDRSKEALQVRIVDSRAVNVINDLGDTSQMPQEFVLARRGLSLEREPFGIVGNLAGGLAPGENFVVDFWLNSKAVSSTTTPVTVMKMGEGLSVVFDPSTSTLTTNYHGLEVVQDYPASGPSWRHVVLDIHQPPVFFQPTTQVNFYLDGRRERNARRNALLSPQPPGGATVSDEISPSGLTFGGGLEVGDRMELDQFRLYSFPSDRVEISPGTVSSLRSTRDLVLPTSNRLIWFDFEEAPQNGVIANGGRLLEIGVGPFINDTRAYVSLQEVATIIESPLDRAGFNGSGYVLNEVSNYNGNLYDRAAEVGIWGPIYPVNQQLLFEAPANQLQVAYYENISLLDPVENPNVAWPYLVAEHKRVEYPVNGPHRDKAIYISSRVGSEGVDRSGRPQQVYGLQSYADFQIYHQPERGVAGYNPNEEHAIAAASNRGALLFNYLGEELTNNPPLAAFALQREINVTSGSGFTSQPWVLVQVNNLTTGEPEMAAYAVETTRSGDLAFPRPTDAEAALVDGLTYLAAENPEDRFLVADPAKIYDFDYQFQYPVLAGDLLIPPYPLNIVVGNVQMPDNRGGNIAVAGQNRRAFWRDVNDNAWVVAGGGQFYHQFFYPFRNDFYLPGAVQGQAVAWLPETTSRNFLGDLAKGANVLDDFPKPVRVIYDTAWRTDYPKLKRGETLTYQGGEYFNENPGANGLPALVAMAATEVVYDSRTPDMVLNESNRNSYAARIVRSLDRREARFTVAQMQAAGFSPAATEKIFIVAERWYFKELPGSLQGRFYFDSLAEKLVFRGRLNEKESGDADLTVGPDTLNILEPNVLNATQRNLLLGISSDQTAWAPAINLIADLSLNPEGIRTAGGSVIRGTFLSGLREAPALTTDANLGETLAEVSRRLAAQEMATFHELLETTPGRFEVVRSQTQPDLRYLSLDSFGVGSSLIAHPNLLTGDTDRSLYVTIAENNRSELNGAAVSLHIIEIIPDRYRGAIKAIEPADAFSERISLQHNGDFGNNTDDLYYEWWIRDAGPLDVVAGEILADGSLAETGSGGASLWQRYTQGLGLNEIIFEGRPDVTLADKLVLMRYRHKSENDWRLVPFEVADASVAWRTGSPAPFQWAGAANSPQLQADGSKRYIPQLILGWVKRILDRINPYEARYTDFFSNESPAVYSSQIQIAGAPFAGKVALNSQKNVIENVGLIELYETILARAKELSIENSTNASSTEAINQALLLAATRLTTLYGLLGGEAYSDAQDSTITVADGESDLARSAGSVHAFENLEANLLQEELALLRGTDFRKSFPIFNRMFWNYTKGLGEAAYNVNYNIYDANADGFINESDARALYPQGHGDAWGHYLSALGMHYELLQNGSFSWKARSELYALLQNVFEVDFLDEKTFAKFAAAKARAGRDIVRNTYRLHYTQDPDGQWQGYTDGADPARAWGVSEWAHRSGQAAYFDWVVANALLPEDAGDATPVVNPENLDRIDRLGNEAEIGEIASLLLEIQTTTDEASSGNNPLGFDSDAIAFDTDPTFVEVGSGTQGETHFEQIYGRALTACNNALATLEFAAQGENKLRRLADDTDAIFTEALAQDLDYRNRLIEIFGRPYDGTIGFGKVYPEGYEGPDTLLFSYLDRTTVERLVPPSRAETDETVIHFSRTYRRSRAAMNHSSLVSLYTDVHGSATGRARLRETFSSLIGTGPYERFVTGLDLPIQRASQYAFQSPSSGEWGRRTSYGSAQQVLEEMLQAEVEWEIDLADYVGYLQDFEALTNRLYHQIELMNERENLGDDIQITRATINSILVAAQVALGAAEIFGDLTTSAADAINEGFPTNTGFSNDVTAPIRAAALGASVAAKAPSAILAKASELAILIGELTRDELIANFEREIGRTEELAELEGIIEELVNLSGGDSPKRLNLGIRLQNLELKRQEYVTIQAEGFRLLKEREAFNKILAANVQGNRYQDMLVRLTRNEAMGNYQSAFNHAARYVWLAAKAYDYETNLDPGSPAAPGGLLDLIVKERQLGLWVDGEPQVGQGGLADILARLKGNFTVLESQLGLNSFQTGNENVSLRKELFRIQNDGRWQDALKSRIVPDLNLMPEFTRYCRPFANADDGPQPGLVIRFSTDITAGKNIFGRALAPGDHSFSAANFTTKIAALGVNLEGYDAGIFSTTPRAYLVPIGTDFMSFSNSSGLEVRAWNVHDTLIPTPFVINQSEISSPGFIPQTSGFSTPRRHGDFRVFYEPDADPAQPDTNTRLVGRSVWNSEWILIIPGAHLGADADQILSEFAENVTDIQLNFSTYSHNGQ